MARLSDKRLAHAAFLYYVQGLSQAEVARELDLTRSNVSRMLSAARDRSIVRFEISYPLERSPAIEREVLAKVSAEGVREVIVVPTREPGVGQASEGLLTVGRAAYGWLDDNLVDNQVLGLCWGTTVESMVASAHFSRRVDVEVVALAGELSIDPRSSGHDLVRMLAEKLGGRYRYFNAPATTSDEETADALRRTPQVADALALARASDVAVLGIGAYGSGSSDLFLQRAQASDDEIREAVQRGVVGQMSGRFFGADGGQIDLSINRRILSLDLNEVRNVATVIAVASGELKAQAVRAAIRGGLVHVLIIDDVLAGALLKRLGTQTTNEAANQQVG